jgi:hypothetical protein
LQLIQIKYLAKVWTSYPVQRLKCKIFLKTLKLEVMMSQWKIWWIIGDLKVRAN